MTEQHYPPGWDADRVKRLIDYYDNLSDEEMIAEDEAATDAKEVTMIAVPKALVDQVRALIARGQSA